MFVIWFYKISWKVSRENLEQRESYTTATAKCYLKITSNNFKIYLRKDLISVQIYR